MANNKKLKWETCIEVDGVIKTIAKSDGDGNIVRRMSEKEFEPLKNRILKNIGEGMSRYLANHPESSLWHTAAREGG